MNERLIEIRKRVSTMPQSLVDKCVRNCHARGLDSIVIDEDSRGSLERMFVSHPGGALENNASGDKFAVGIHEHHYPITLEAVSGEVWNLTYALFFRADLKLKAYTFAHNMDGKPTIRPLGETGVLKIATSELSQRAIQQIHLQARELHTIVVPATSRGAAWIVREGERETDATLLLTDKDMTTFVPDGLYQPFRNRQHILDMLDSFIATQETPQ